jgi:hypothetical protein
MEPPGPVGPGPGEGEQPGGGGGTSANQCQITISGPGTFVGQFVQQGGGGGGGGAPAARAVVSTCSYICVNLRLLHLRKLTFVCIHTFA